MKLDPHLKEFVEQSNGLSGIFLNDSKYKPKTIAGYTWDDDRFSHHYEILCWVISLAKSGIMPTAHEINKRLMERFMDDETYRYAGKLRRKDIASNRIIIPAAYVPELYGEWEAASQRFASNNVHNKLQYVGCPHCQSAWMHKVFMYIRPFEDGNARTARMIWAAHMVLSGMYPVEVVCGKDLPMSIHCADAYDESLIEFTETASMSEILKQLNSCCQNREEQCCEIDHSVSLIDIYDPTLYKKFSSTKTENNDDEDEDKTDAEWLAPKNI